MVAAKMSIFLAIAWSMVAFSSGFPPEYDHGVSLPTTKPLIVAHRGSSGMLPEHTVAAYQLAIDQGADIIECDLSVTKDLRLVCLHESWMNDTTDVALKFPEDRSTTYYVTDQGRDITDYFTVDFTLAELQTLRINQRFASRDPSKNGEYAMATLEEYIEVAKNAGRPIGIYPETKEPEWVNSLAIMKEANKTFEELLIDVLKSYDYDAPTNPCFVQSFSLDSLYRLRDMTSLPLIRLMSSSVEYMDEELDEIAQFCYGIGPHKTHIVRVSSATNYITEVTDFVQRAHDRGLRVHPYTFRNEHEYLAYDYGLDPHAEMEHFLELEIDGYFTDFPASVYRYYNATYTQDRNSATGCVPCILTYSIMTVSFILASILSK